MWSSSLQRRNIRLLIAYEGTRYLGWQETKEGPSIEGAVKAALESLVHHPVQLQAASRTDVGVHAAGQVAHFFLEAEGWECRRLFRALNGTLPRDIAVLEVKEMPLTFHPTLEAKSKEYHYWVCHGEVQMPHVRHFSWHVPANLNEEAMQQAMQILTGEQDYSAFTNFRKQLRYKNYVRKVTHFSYKKEASDRLCFEIAGEHFLYKMVRNLVGTVVDMGKGRFQIEELKNILASGERSLAGVTAPAHGLILKRVIYE